MKGTMGKVLRVDLTTGDIRQEDIPDEVRYEIHFIFVDTIDQVLFEALGVDLHETRAPIPVRNRVIPVENI